ncbi:hypothetical protein VSDG_10123 [Cytospora chrysosperma]|uniref:Uncharacterized protein n=1 Tax=Cytospora chrysosperma TaxID=252740 RepID=A0A423V8A1_CYTCH|nr:hypothetical protein VSDG_10123 [Valsa sordida]
MAAPIPLRRCFLQPFTLSLDNYHAEPTTNTNPSSSSVTTANVDPPSFAHKILTAYWTDLCNAFISAIPAARLTDEYLSHAERLIRHASEADVVRTAALYVLHPINQAFSAHSATAGTVTCLAELSSANLRADITYFKCPPNPGQGNKRAFAVIEFKKRQLINSTEFARAEKCNSSMSEAQIRQNVAQISQQAKGRNIDHTFYDGYSCKLVKQAAAYAITHRTKYIALFNWEALVLIRFQAMELLNHNGSLKSVGELQADGVGEWCQTTVITQSVQMRPALLGFLSEAYDATPF